MIQPQIPLRLPCYDLIFIAESTLGPLLNSETSGIPNSADLTGSVYKTRERIHRRIADRRLLAIPTSWGRISALNPNWDWFLEISSLLLSGNSLYQPL